MYGLDIFLEAQISWETFVEFLQESLCMKGRDVTDDVRKRHIWRLFDIEILAYPDPDLDDDQGIPFSTFTFQVQLVLANMRDHDESNRFRHALARMLVVKIRKRLDHNVRLVRNLQTEILIDEVVPPTNQFEGGDSR